MSAESTKGSNGSDPDNVEEKGKQGSDSETETKIKNDVEEHEKDSPRGADSRSDGRKSASSRQGSADGQPGSRPRSSATGEEKVFEVKPKKKVKAGELDPDGHEVTFTVTISIAVPTGEL